jgi:hypothetical protein
MRREQPIKFYKNSTRRIGRQALGNRLKHIFDVITAQITLEESNDSLRVKLKKSLGLPGKSTPAAQETMRLHRTTWRRFIHGPDARQRL